MPQIDLNKLRQQVDSSTRTRSSTRTGHRKFLHRVGGAMLGLLGGGIITIIFLQVFWFIAGKYSPLEPIVGMGSTLLFCLGGIYRGWTGKAKMNGKLEYTVGIIVMLILVGFAISKCS